MIQKIDRIQPYFDFSFFVDPDAFYEIRIQPDSARSFKPGIAEISHLSRRWIHENQTALCIGNGEVAVEVLERLRRRYTRSARIWNLAYAIEVRNHARQIGFFTSPKSLASGVTTSG